MTDQGRPAAAPEPSDDAQEVAEAAGAAEREVRGLHALTAEEFSIADSVGGVRGLAEALAPGLVFIIVYLVSRDLTPALVASLVVTVVAVVLRLAQRTPLTQALSGLFGVAVGVFWAWRTGEARDFFQFGLWTNGAYLAVCLVSVVVRWPAVGVVLGPLRAGLGGPPADRAESADSEADASPSTDVREVLAGWRHDAEMMRRYVLATWLWIGLFGLRLLVQVPLFVAEDAVGWLGTARLVMGVPLWALTLWGTWVLVRRPAAGPAPARPRPGS